MRVAGKAAPAAKFLSEYLNREVLNSSVNLAAKGKALARVLPLLELLGVVYFYGNDFVELGQLLIEMIQSPETMLALADYITGYLEAQELGFASSSVRSDEGDSFLPIAYAALVRRPQIVALLGRFQRLYDDIPASGPGKLPEVGSRLGRAIESIANALAKDIPPDGLDVKVLFKEPALRAFYVAARLGRADQAGRVGDDALEALTRFRGSGPDGPTNERVLEAVGDLVDALDEFDAEDVGHARKLLDDLGQPRGNGNFLAQGASWQVVAIQRRRGPGPTRTRKLVGIEVPDSEPIVAASGKRVGSRRRDAVFEDHTFEMKSHAPATLEERLRKALRLQQKADGTEDLVGGQLARDILDMHTKGESWGLHRWGWDDLPFNGKQGEAKAEAIREIIKDELTNNQQTRTLLDQAMKLGGDKDALNAVIRRFLDNEI